MNRTLNREELAWAAGFFDGEGNTHYQSSLSKRPKDKGRNSRTIRVNITQLYSNLEVLSRFHVAVGKIGHFNGPIRLAMTYNATSFEEAQAVIAMLWKFLSSKKRAQAREALLAFKNHRF